MRRALLIAACMFAIGAAGVQAQEPSPEPSPAAAEPSPSPSPRPAEPSPPPSPEPTPSPEPSPEASPAEPAAPVPPGAGGAGGPGGSLPVYGPVSSKVFNPDIAVIGNFTGAVGENAVDPRPSLTLQEAEASLQAIVDPYARADFFLTFSPEEVGVEEGYITFTSLPAGFLMKVGKFKASFGKVNTLHPHVLPWIDLPLAMVNLLGGEEGFNDAGVSVSRLFPNSFAFLEATGEVYRGEVENLFAAPRRRDVALVGHLRAYRDLTESTNLELGGSVARGTNDTGAGFRTTLYGADLTLRWRPLRRAIYRRLMLRSELFWSRREQAEAVIDPGSSGAGQGAGEPPGSLTARAFGFYASAEYQLGRRWFAAARYDSSERARDASLRDRAGSVLLTYWPSEFSQIRGQLRRTSYADGPAANELLFQFLFAIGAHGAHPF